MEAMVQRLGRGDGPSWAVFHSRIWCAARQKEQNLQTDARPYTLDKGASTLPNLLFLGDGLLSPLLFREKFDVLV